MGVPGCAFLDFKPLVALEGLKETAGGYIWSVIWMGYIYTRQKRGKRKLDKDLSATATILLTHTCLLHQYTSKSIL